MPAGTKRRLSAASGASGASGAAAAAAAAAAIGGGEESNESASSAASANCRSLFSATQYEYPPTAAAAAAEGANDRNKQQRGPPVADATEDAAGSGAVSSFPSSGLLAPDTLPLDDGAKNAGPHDNNDDDDNDNTSGSSSRSRAAEDADASCVDDTLMMTTTMPAADRTPRKANSSRRRASSGSLFGAVMNHVQESDQHRTSSGGSYQDAASAAAAAAFSGGGDDDDDDDDDDDSFAAGGGALLTEKPSMSMPPPSAMSPGGFQLMDFVNTVSSPFFVPNSKRRGRMTAAAAVSAANCAMSPESTASNASRSPAATGRQEGGGDADSWQEIRAPDFPIVDWSLKSQLTVEAGDNHNDTDPAGSTNCGPNNGSYFRRMGRDARIQQRAKLRFLSASSTATTIEEEEDPAVQWHSALLYWRYPSSAGHATILLGGSNRRIVNDNDNRNNSQDNDASQLSLWSPTDNNNRTRDTDAGSSFCSSSPSAHVRQQLRQWQQAFQSLYATWIRRVRRLSPSSPSPDDCYFYACGQGRVVLFGTAAAASDVATTTTTTTTIQPQVVLSSSTAEMRTKLRKVGVSALLVYNDSKRRFEELNEDGEEEKENDQQPSNKGGSDISNDAEDAASPGVKAELAALRRAQACGHTVGPDVSISIKNNKNSKAIARSKWLQQSYRTSPTVLRGFDDVAAFFELYLNSIMDDASKQPQVVLPTLVCRELGPFLHSSLETLQVQQHHQRHEVTVHGGMILPDSLRQLVAAAIRLEEHQQQQLQRHHGRKASCQTDAANDDDDDEGDSDDSDEDTTTTAPSRHMIFRTDVHEGIPPLANRTATSSRGTIGTHSSQWINHAATTRGRKESRSESVRNSNNGGGGGEREGEEDSSCHYCPHGRVLSMAVWDSTRPSTLAYKLNGNWMTGL